MKQGRIVWIYVDLFIRSFVGSKLGYLRVEHIATGGTSGLATVRRCCWNRRYT